MIDRILWQTVLGIVKIEFVFTNFSKRGIKMENEKLILGPFELRVYIEFLRKELIQLGKNMGLSHQLTIQASEELDYFLNEYTKINNIYQ